MLHTDLIFTIVTAFVAAFVGGFVAARLKLPPIVGYLLAGVVIGPYTPGGSASPEIASSLAEIGVILLMFGVGLHFSLREIAEVGPVAIPGALGQSTVATVLGVGIALFWGWSLTEGILLGLCLSVASTVVLLRALEDRSLLDTYSGHVAVGWLIAEDLFTVLVLVLLPALSGSDEAASGLVGLLGVENSLLKVGLALAQAGIFVLLMLVVGPRVIPRILSEVVRAGSRELFTLGILAIALGVAFGSSELFGASLALGAFLAGVVLNESELSHRAGLEALPLRDAFAVLFFVSVGMIFDPDVLIDAPLRVLAVVLIIMVGKSLAAFVIVTSLGYGLRTSVTVAAALSQIGEFSFILVSLGVMLNLFPQEGTSLILAGAIVSITLNPLVFSQIERVEGYIGRSKAFVRFAERRHPEQSEALSLRRHVIICGFGRTGSSLARTLAGRELPFVVIENNPFVFERVRAAGYPAVFGDASQAVVLSQARLIDARALAITFAGYAESQLTVRSAQLLQDGIDIVARAWGAESHTLLRKAGASEVVDPDFESSLEFVRHVLHRYGIDSREIVALQARRRAEYYREPQS